MAQTFVAMNGLEAFMGFNCGIVGLPGKSTLFNALPLQQQQKLRTTHFARLNLIR